MYVNSHTSSNYIRLEFQYHHSSISYHTSAWQSEIGFGPPSTCYITKGLLLQKWCVGVYVTSVAKDISYVHAYVRTYVQWNLWRCLMYQMFHSLLGAFVNNWLTRRSGTGAWHYRRDWFYDWRLATGMRTLDVTDWLYAAAETFGSLNILG